MTETEENRVSATWPDGRNRERHFYGLRDDEFKSFATAANSINWNSLVERCQFATLANGQSQQVHIRDVNMRDDRIWFEDLEDTDILCPEVMAWGLA